MEHLHSGCFFMYTGAERKCGRLHGPAPAQRAGRKAFPAGSRTGWRGIRPLKRPRPGTPGRGKRSPNTVGVVKLNFLKKYIDEMIISCYDRFKIRNEIS